MKRLFFYEVFYDFTTDQLSSYHIRITFDEQGSGKAVHCSATLTGAVRDVENELGIQIFRRTHKGVTATVEGEAFLAKIKRVYQQYEEVMEEYGEEMDFRRRFAVSMQHY